MRQRSRSSKETTVPAISDNRYGGLYPPNSGEGTEGRQEGGRLPALRDYGY